MRHNLLLMLIPFSHLLFSLSTAQKEAGGPKVDDPKRQELFQRKGSDRLPVPGAVMKRMPAIMGDSEVHICFHVHSFIPLTLASVLHETHTDFPAPPHAHFPPTSHLPQSV